jgi:hypothetical protein
MKSTLNSQFSIAKRSQLDQMEEEGLANTWSRLREKLEAEVNPVLLGYEKRNHRIPQKLPDKHPLYSGL